MKNNLAIMRYATFATLLILLSALAVWQFFPPADNGTLAEIKRRGTIRVGMDASFPPFEVMDGNGQIMGLDVDIARVIATDLGVELKLVNIGFDGLYDALLAHRADIIISGLPYDPRWTQDVAYTNNYFNAGQVLIRLADDRKINTVEDLDGQTVSIEWGSQADMVGRRLSKKMEGLSLLRRDSAAEAVNALLNGQATAAIVDAVSGVTALPKGVKIVTYLTDEWYAAAVHIESRELLKAVNHSLIQLEESGEMAKLQARWLNEQ